VPLANGAPRVRLIDAAGHDAPGAARLVIDRPGRLAIHVESQTGGVVALTERFHDGWTATANGSPIALVRVADDFLGCAVGPGPQMVQLRFAPRSFRIGVLLSAIGAVLLVLLVVAGRPGSAKA
jgi:uncharacterized membrane protein YfhO